jgi:flavodoxin
MTTVAIVYRSNHGHAAAVAEAHAVEANDQEGKIVVRI